MGTSSNSTCLGAVTISLLGIGLISFFASSPILGCARRLGNGRYCQIKSISVTIEAVSSEQYRKQLQPTVPRTGGLPYYEPKSGRAANDLTCLQYEPNSEGRAGQQQDLYLIRGGVE